MSKVYQKIELTANVLIIVVAVMLAGVLIQRYIFAGSSQPARKSPTVGTKISDLNFDWSKANKNVLLVLQKGCKYCSESAEFYKKLIQQTRDKNVKITAVLPQPKEEAEKYLDELGVSGIEIKQSQLSTLNVGGTPTIIVADDKGEISDAWTGKLPPDKESEVISKLTL
jgi:thioredoxin-related protein